MITSHTFHVHFWLKKNTKRKDQTFPVYARISLDSTRVDLSTKQVVLEQDWCEQSKRVFKRRTNAKTINEELDEIASNLKRAYRELKTEGLPITAKAIKLRYTGSDLFQKCISRTRERPVFVFLLLRSIIYRFKGTYHRSTGQGDGR